jgi:membrane-associated phospholipid phosphatase
MSLKRDWKLVWLSTLHSFRMSPRGFWLVWAVFLIVSAAILAPFDFVLFEKIRAGSPQGSRHLTDFFAQAGKFEYINLIGTILLMGLAYATNNRWMRRVAMSFFLASALAGISVQVVKPLVGRPRPSQCLDEKIDPFEFRAPTFKRRFHSYPSGHTTTTVAACSVVAIAFPRLLVPCVILGLAMAWARIAGISHFPTDTLHGAVIGFLCAYLCTRWLKKRHRPPQRETQAMRCQPIRRKPAPPPGDGENQSPDLLT